jgi:hypothetical protein
MPGSIRNSQPPGSSDARRKAKATALHVGTIAAWPLVEGCKG